jgi:MFS family permease
MTSVSTAQASAVRNYALVTAAYWGFTITDGAIRMLVLLHFHKLGFTPIQIAMLFLFYEIFGVITNFLGGWIGSLFGLRLTLYGGIAIQIFGLVMLGVLNMQWPVWGQVAYVMTAQALAGIAKDLTKMSSKSAIRLVVPKEAESRLFRWVAMLTGSKNALKGVGFFVESGPAADLHRNLRGSHGLPHGQLCAGGGRWL